MRDHARATADVRVDRQAAGLHQPGRAADAPVAAVPHGRVAAGGHRPDAGCPHLAAFAGRDYAVPDDVVQLALPALRHRVILTAEAEVEGRQVDELLTRIAPLRGGPADLSDLMNALAAGLEQLRAACLAAVAAAVLSAAGGSGLAGAASIRTGCWCCWDCGPCVLTLDCFGAWMPCRWFWLVDAALAGRWPSGDLFSLPPAGPLRPSGRRQRIASLRKSHPVTLTVSNRGSRRSDRDGSATTCPESSSRHRQEFSLRPAGTQPSDAALRAEGQPPRGLPDESRVLAARSRLGIVESHCRLPVDHGRARLSGHEAVGRVCRAGPHEPAEPDGRAADPQDRPGQRVRAAPRLYAGRQLQTHRLAEHRPPSQADRQGLSDPARASGWCSCWTAGG